MHLYLHIFKYLAIRLFILHCLPHFYVWNSALSWLVVQCYLFHRRSPDAFYWFQMIPLGLLFCYFGQIWYFTLGILCGFLSYIHNLSYYHDFLLLYLYVTLRVKHISHWGHWWRRLQQNRSIQTSSVLIGKHAWISLEFWIIIVLNILSAVQKRRVLMLCR